METATTDGWATRNVLTVRSKKYSFDNSSYGFRARHGAPYFKFQENEMFKLKKSRGRFIEPHPIEYYNSRNEIRMTRIFTVQQVAQILGVDVDDVRFLIDRHVIRTWRGFILPDDLDLFIINNFDKYFCRYNRMTGRVVNPPANNRIPAEAKWVNPEMPKSAKIWKIMDGKPV